MHARCPVVLIGIFCCNDRWAHTNSCSSNGNGGGGSISSSSSKKKKKKCYATESLRANEEREEKKKCANKIRRFNIMYTLSMLSPFNVKYARYIIIIYYIRKQWRATEWARKQKKMREKNRKRRKAKCAHTGQKGARFLFSFIALIFWFSCEFLQSGRRS